MTLPSMTTSALHDAEQIGLVRFPAEGAYRVGRREDALALSWISGPDSQRPTGNRYDVAGGGVLYCATELQACYAETLGRFRPSPVLVAALGLDEAGRMTVGSVAADWRMRRVKVRVQCRQSLPFIDVEDPRTLAYLGEVLARDLSALDIQQPLDVSLMRGLDRRIPRLVARWAHSQQDDDGNPLFSGLRYESKFGGYECWAIFDGTPVHATETLPVSKDDPALEAVAAMFKLTIH